VNTVLGILVIAGLAIAAWRWYQSAIRKWTWQAVEKICMGARIRLARRYQTRYQPEAASRIASAVIARLLPLEEGLPFTWNTLGMAREAPAAAVDNELRQLDFDESVRRGLVYAAYGVFHARRLTSSVEAGMLFLNELERRGLRWRDIPMPHAGEFLDFASNYLSEGVALVASDAFAQTNQELSELLKALDLKNPQQPKSP
jgi:hypothetical protein